MRIGDIHDPSRGWTKGMPTHFTMADTPFRLDPTRCPHHLVQFKGTKFVDDYHRHQLFDIFRCEDCGKVHEEPRDVRSAGYKGSKEIDDPRVLKTLMLTPSVLKRFFRE